MIRHDGHLTDEHFAELLSGEAAHPAAELHLQGCAQCREELGTLTVAAAEFNTLSLAWAQTVAPRRIAAPTRFERLVARGGPVWALGLTAALVAGMVTTHFNSPAATGEQGIPAVMGTAPAAPSELAADNRLMQSIDDELQGSPQPAVPVSELRGSARRIAQPPTAAVTD